MNCIVFHAVDLGLSVKWSTCNLGATKPEECGDYYGWGETIGWQGMHDWSFYKWCNYGRPDCLSKYNTNSNYGGNVDNKTVLDAADDVARVKLGGTWRMPTRAECEELLKKCTWTWTTRGGVNGYKVTSKIHDNSIFLPAAGCWDGTTLYGLGESGGFWSSSLNTGCPRFAFQIGFHRDGAYGSSNGTNRYLGCSIRPVFSE